jgi:hypothetical protein
MKKGYHFINFNHLSPPPFFQKLTDALAHSWKSLGSIGCKLTEVSDGRYEAIFFPALREIYGGKSDGEVVFPGFNFNVGLFVRVFDESPAPKVSFDSLRTQYIPHLIFKGYIDGTFLKVNILECPPNGQYPVERVYASGPKKGQVETIKK